MLNVGLTGGIATGKSTVVRMLMKKGARVIDHDGLVHILQEPGRPVWKRIIEAFGRDILDTEDRIDPRSSAPSSLMMSRGVRHSKASSILPFSRRRSASGMRSGGRTGRRSFCPISRCFSKWGCRIVLT
jgi:hypothetical protein